MIQKWQALLAQLDVLESFLGQEIWREQDFLVFEAETSIILPAGYKEFFQIFGPGM